MWHEKGRRVWLPDNSLQLPPCTVMELSTYQTLPLLCPTALLCIGLAVGLGKAGTGWGTSLSPGGAPAPHSDAVPLAGRRDGAQCHAPLQEEVRHHAAVQAHLSWGLTRSPRRTRNAALSAHTGPRDCVTTLAPASNLAGTWAPATSSGPLGPVTLSHPTGVVSSWFLPTCSFPWLL